MMSFTGLQYRQEKSFVNRYIIVAAVFMLVILLLIVRLFFLQFIKGESYRSTSTALKTVTLRTVGERGAIYDRNGIPLAYNVQSYTVTFTRDPEKRTAKYREYYSKILLKTISIIEGNGCSVINTFPIRRQSDGTYAFEWGDVSAETAARKEKRWKADMALPEKNYSMTPEELFNYFATYYKVPEGLSYDDVFKLLSVWQEVQFTSYQSYISATIAENVDMNTVAEIEIYSNELDGVSIGTSTSRVYPKQSLAAHLIGYTGKITNEDTLMEMLDMGYQRSDIIGIAGVESSLEYELSPNLTERSGEKVVEVNNRGKIINTISSTRPSDGNDITLTIDANLQLVAEEALEETINLIHAEQISTYNKKMNNDTDKDDYEKKLEDINLAEVGALVVMDVQTAEVLALASYPSYDVNIFTDGLSTEEYDAIKNDKRNPLFNNAIASRSAPGSVFKMATGLAGLMEEAVSMTEKIDDEGPYDKYVQTGHVASCWVRPYFNKHNDQDISKALKNSCNYYFFEVADRLGIDKLDKWASLLGLDSQTGIELPGEKTGQIGCQEVLYNSERAPTGTSYLIYKYIRNLLTEACKGEGLEYSDDLYDKTTLKLMELIDLTGGLGPDIRGILMSDLNLTLKQIKKYLLDSEISSRLSEIRWDANDTILVGIGQSVTLVTPIAVARYVCALVNGGNVYEARIVKSTTTAEGEVRETVPQLVRNIGANAEYLNAIKEGMREVVSLEDGGTAGQSFAGFEYKDDMGGKTGSAQVSTIDLETNAWFVAFAPYEQAEIVVVAYIPHGMGGAKAAPAIKKVIQYYRDNKKSVSGFDSMPQTGELLP